jgi:hypothetical protein
MCESFREDGSSLSAPRAAVCERLQKTADCRQTWNFGQADAGEGKGGKKNWFGAGADSFSTVLAVSCDILAGFGNRFAVRVNPPPQ